MLHTLEETIKFIDGVKKYPNDVRIILFDVWQKSIELSDIKLARKLTKIYPLFPILSCIAGLNFEKIIGDFYYKETANDICYNYLKQFHPELF